MLLTGTFPRNVDEKCRIAIPKPLRDILCGSADSEVAGSELKVALYFAPGTDGSLALYPESAFALLGHRLAQASPTAREVREYSRMFYAQAARVELDGQGRVRIPQELADLVGLGRDVVLLGVQDHLELWNRAQWESYFQDKLGRYDQIAEAAFGGSEFMAPRAAQPGLRSDQVESPPRKAK